MVTCFHRLLLLPTVTLCLYVQQLPIFRSTSSVTVKDRETKEVFSTHSFSVSVWPVLIKMYKID